MCILILNIPTYKFISSPSGNLYVCLMHYASTLLWRILFLQCHSFLQLVQQILFINISSQPQIPLICALQSHFEKILRTQNLWTFNFLSVFVTIGSLHFSCLSVWAFAKNKAPATKYGKKPMSNSLSVCYHIVIYWRTKWEFRGMTLVCVFASFYYSRYHCYY